MQQPSRRSILRSRPPPPPPPLPPPPIDALRAPVAILGGERGRQKEGSVGTGWPRGVLRVRLRGLGSAAPSVTAARRRPCSPRPPRSGRALSPPSFSPVPPRPLPLRLLVPGPGSVRRAVGRPGGRARRGWRWRSGFPRCSSPAPSSCAPSTCLPLPGGRDGRYQPPNPALQSCFFFFLFFFSSTLFSPLLLNTVRVLFIRRVCVSTIKLHQLSPVFSVFRFSVSVLPKVSVLLAPILSRICVIWRL